MSPRASYGIVRGLRRPPSGKSLQREASPSHEFLLHGDCFEEIELKGAALMRKGKKAAREKSR